MTLLFWLCLALIIYAYFGYALLLWVAGLVGARPVAVATVTMFPSVTVVIAAHNEEMNLPAKLQNLATLDYPRDRLNVVVASDGSTDRTVELLAPHFPFISTVVLHQSAGKAAALNQAVKNATGEILVFLDVRQRVENNAIAELVTCFADPEIGAVSGELLLSGPSEEEATDALGLYWRIEKFVRKMESLSGSTVGVTGAIYAIRRELYTDMPVGTILDDVFVPMSIVRQGRRVIFQPSAIAHDRLFSQKGKEFSRKVRTLTGNYQLIRLAPWLLTPSNPILFRFISHKLLRLGVPFFLVGLFLASASHGRPFYRIAALLQIVFYLLAIVGSISPSFKTFRPAAIANTFVMLNCAAAVALYNFIVKKEKVWIS